jgi:hypothetical protein
VEEDVREPLGRDGLPVDGDGVAGADERIEAAGLAVDADASRLDQLIGTPP